jgi:transcriptional pleiotropic repressor
MSLFKQMQQLKSHKHNYEVVNNLTSLIAVNAYLIDLTGNIIFSNVGVSLSLKMQFQQRVSFVFETMANIFFTGSFLECYDSTDSCFITILPIKNVGHILLTKDQELTENELILSEFAALLVNMPNISEQGKLATIIDTLSYSEIQAMNGVFKVIDGLEGSLVTSRIADGLGFSRSIIVNALHKLESAGILNSRSLGVGGTHIKINSQGFVDAIYKRCS